jgi:hypothetical protein
VRVEVFRAAYDEESVPGVPVQEKMMEAPATIVAAGANVSPRSDDSRANEAEPQPEDAPGRAALTLGSFDIVDLGNGELGLQGYYRAPLPPARWGKVVGCKVDMLACCNRVPTHEGDADHGWLGCSATSPGLS